MSEDGAMYTISSSSSKRFLLPVSTDDRSECKCVTGFTNSSASLRGANPPTAALCGRGKRRFECWGPPLLLHSLATGGQCCVAHESRHVVRAHQVPTSPGRSKFCSLGAPDAGRGATQAYSKSTFTAFIGLVYRLI